MGGGAVVAIIGGGTCLLLIFLYKKKTRTIVEGAYISAQHYRAIQKMSQ